MWLPESQSNPGPPRGSTGSGQGARMDKDSAVHYLQQRQGQWSGPQPQGFAPLAAGTPEVASPGTELQQRQHQLQPEQQHPEQALKHHESQGIFGPGASIGAAGGIAVSSISSAGIGSLANVCSVEYGVVRSGMSFQNRSSQQRQQEHQHQEQHPYPVSTSPSVVSPSSAVNSYGFASASKRPRTCSTSVGTFTSYPTAAPSSDGAVGKLPRTRRTPSGESAPPAAGTAAGTTAAAAGSGAKNSSSDSASILPPVFLGPGGGQWDSEWVQGTALAGDAVAAGSQLCARLPSLSRLLEQVRPRGSPLPSGEDQNRIGGGMHTSSSPTFPPLPVGGGGVGDQQQPQEERGAPFGAGGGLSIAGDHQLQQQRQRQSVFHPTMEMIPQQQQQQGYASLHPIGGHHASFATYGTCPNPGVPVRSSQQLTGAGDTGTEAAPGAGGRAAAAAAAAASTAKAPNFRQELQISTEASRKRPRSSSPGGTSLVDVGLSGRAIGSSELWHGGTGAGGGVGGMGGIFASAPRQRRLGRCLAEGCGEPAVVMVERKRGSLETESYCRDHSGLAPPTQALSSHSTASSLPLPLFTPRLPPPLSSVSTGTPSAFVAGLREDPLASISPHHQRQQQQPPQRRRELSQAALVTGAFSQSKATSVCTSAITSASLSSSAKAGGGGVGGGGGGASGTKCRGRSVAQSDTPGSTNGSSGGSGSSSGSVGGDATGGGGGSLASGTAGGIGTRGGGKCEVPGCTTQPRYAAAGATRPQFCGLHKHPGQMNIVSRCCKHPECSKVPHFGKNHERPLYCGEHKLEGMVNVANRRCEDPDCQRQPTYGNKGDKRPRFCSTHKHPGMYDVIARRCEQEGCMTRAAFNFHGQKAVRYCAAHKLEGMENLKSKCCEVDGCKKYRVYGFDGEPAVCCASHKREGMVDVRSSRCEFSGCFRHPSFGYKWEKKRRFCGRHKLADMMDVRSRNQTQKGAGAGAGSGERGGKNRKTSPAPPGAKGGQRSRQSPTQASTAGPTDADFVESQDTHKESSIAGEGGAVAGASRGCSPSSAPDQRDSDSSAGDDAGTSPSTSRSASRPARRTQVDGRNAPWK